MLRISEIDEEQLQEGELLHEGRASSGNDTPIGLIPPLFSTIDEREFFLFFYKTRVGRPRGRRLAVHEGQVEIQLGREARE